MTISNCTIGIISPAFESFKYWSHILESEEELVIEGHTYHAGFINGLRVVFLECDIDAAAVSLTRFSLSHLYPITHLVYMGYAGAVNEKLKVGDMVLATQVLTQTPSPGPNGNHKELEENSIEIIMDSEVSNLLHQAAEQVILASGTDPLISAEQERQFKLNASPGIVSGLVAVGDPFFISAAKRQGALQLNPNLTCLEKESLAVALIGKQRALPVGIIHMIVQAPDDTEQMDYTAFITNVANRYLAEIAFTFIHLFSELSFINEQPNVD